jgi:hypothetical protein
LAGNAGDRIQISSGTVAMRLIVMELGRFITVFDVDSYTLSATLTFPAGSPYVGFDTSVGPCGANPACDVTVLVTKDTSAIALSSSQNPSPLGSPVTISATATGGFGAIPTGQVIFNLDGAALAPAALDATGTASFTTANLALGTHNITASYAGALDFFPAANAGPFSQQIVPPATTAVVTSSLNPSTLGDKVTFTASITNAAGFIGTPSGSVIFRDGNVNFATAPIVQKGGQNVSQATVSTLAAGSHSITAAYSGDGTSGASVSPVYIQQQVNYPLTLAPPGYRITVTPSPVVLGVGQTIQLTVTVTAVSGFSEPVTLSCSNLPNESACTFDDTVIPAGGGEHHARL